MAVCVYKSRYEPSGPAFDKRRKIVIPARTGGNPAKLDIIGLILSTHFFVLFPIIKPKGTPKTVAIVVDVKQINIEFKTICSISFISNR